MKLLFLFAVLVVSANAQLGWRSLTSTHLHDVCPPNNGTGAGNDFTNYGFTGHCDAGYTSWQTGRIDTKRNRLYTTLGGHNDYYGNEIYALDLNASPPAWSRLTSPVAWPDAPWPSCTAAGESIGSGLTFSPIARHTWEGEVYLPRSDKLFFFGGYKNPACNTAAIWVFDPAQNIAVATPWTHKFPISGSYDPETINDMCQGGTCSVRGASCYLDTTNTDTSKDSILCTWGTRYNLIRFDYTVATGVVTGTELAGYASMCIVSDCIPSAASGAIDPRRKKMIFFGDAYQTGTPEVWSVSIVAGGPYTVTNLSSTVVGCSVPASTDQPGVIYDPLLDRIVVYPSNVAGGNTVYLFNPDTNICVPATFTGGPTVGPGIVTTQSVGIFGHFNYSLVDGQYVVCPTAPTNCYRFKLEPKGVGSSTTLTCLDKDGDGYGVGPGCVGVDADDNDATIHTGAQVLSTYSTIPAFLAAAKGYAPANICYVSTTGNNGTAAVDNAALPWLTVASAQGTCGAGKAIMLRGGTYTNAPITPVSGTISAPTIVMAYPGEQPIITSVNATIDIQDKSYVILDGLTLGGGASGGCITGGSDSQLFYGITVRNMEAYNCFQGFIASGESDLLIEDNAWHDNYSGGQHCIYVGARANPSTSTMIRRNICYNAAYNGIHVNGRVSNLTIAQNIIYNSQISGISLQNGTTNSLFEANLSFGHPTAGIEISEYAGDCSLYSLGGSTTYNCPWAQTGNTFRNNTSYGVTSGANGFIVCNYVAGGGTCTSAVYSAGGIPAHLLGNQTLINNVFVGYSGAGSPLGGYPAVVFTNPGETYLSTSSFTNNLHWNAAGTAYGFGYQAGSNFGYAGYNCTGAAALTTLTGCLNGNPLFITPGSNFKISSSSPAYQSGVPTATQFDLIGTSYSPTAPNIGAYEGGVATGGGNSFGGKATFGGKGSGQ